jgi:hypothetical protein
VDESRLWVLQCVSAHVMVCSSIKVMLVVSAYNKSCEKLQCPGIGHKKLRCSGTNCKKL